MKQSITPAQRREILIKATPKLVERARREERLERAHVSRGLKTKAAA